MFLFAEIEVARGLNRGDRAMLNVRVRVLERNGVCGVESSRVCVIKEQSEQGVACEIEALWGGRVEVVRTFQGSQLSRLVESESGVWSCRSGWQKEGKRFGGEGGNGCRPGKVRSYLLRAQRPKQDRVDR